MEVAAAGVVGVVSAGAARCVEPEHAASIKEIESAASAFGVWRR